MLQFENLFEKAILMCPMVVPLRYNFIANSYNCELSD